MEEEQKQPPTPNSPLPGYRLIPEDQYIDPRNTSEDEIDLLELAKKIWAERWLIVKFVIVGAIIGVIAAVTAPKEYVSTAKLMPEYSGQQEGGGASSLLKRFGGLAGLSGISAGGSAGAELSVLLYPDIVSSVAFQHKLAQQPFYYTEIDTSASLYSYFIDLQQPTFMGTVKKYTIGLPGLIIGAIFSKDEVESGAASTDQAILALSKDQTKVVQEINSRISASLNEESGIITVSAKFQNPKLAAEIAKFTIEELTAYVIEYRTEKVLRNLAYLEEQLLEAEKRFDLAQLTLAEFRDSNRGTLTNRAQTEEERLQSEYTLAFDIYNSLSQQREESKLKVQEETPVFKVLQPVLVPVDDQTKGSMFIAVWVLLSGMLSIGWIFGRDFYNNSIQQ